MEELKVSLQGSEGGGMNVQGLPPGTGVLFLHGECKKYSVGGGQNVPVITA